ncbi:hypothetical protein D7W82_21240 [Corallococcus sp. CA049B]|nr:hypothetical protein [Corallococcus coralloides]RKG84850.1 hypothetical protein D7W82_21240 [Corallococcus sp. CA049B]
MKVHHRSESRSQRSLWLLEELGLDYEVVRYERDPKTDFAPPELKAYLDRLHARPADQRALERGGPYKLGR